MAEIRLQKILAQAGYGSRRNCEDLILAGRVTVNGSVVSIGAKADPDKDTIKLDNKMIRRIQANRKYIALNKPKYVLSDRQESDPRRSVFDLVQDSENLFSVGRLDYESEGLILLTNDGTLANELTHPRFGHEKEYRVLVGRRPDTEQLTIWRRGVELEDGIRSAPARVEVDQVSGSKVWLRVILREGRKRQIREIGAKIGLPVLRIFRVRIGTLQLGNLKPGEWRHLTQTEIDALKSSTEPMIPNKKNVPNRKTTQTQFRKKAVRS